MDIVAEVKWRATDTVIFEPQSYLQKDFNERIFHYFSLLHRKLAKLIIPIAIFSYDENCDKNSFHMTIGDFDILHFNYLTIHLKKLNWRTFIKQNNPVSAALLSKMGYNNKEGIKVKLEFLRILTTLQLNLEKQDLLFDFFQSYLKLNEDEEESLMKEVSKHENAEEILEVTNPYIEKGKKIGREEGREEGREKGRKEERLKIARNMLEANFTIEQVVQATKLKREEVEQLK